MHYHLQDVFVEKLPVVVLGVRDGEPLLIGI